MAVDTVMQDAESTARAKPSRKDAGTAPAVVPTEETHRILQTARSLLQRDRKVHALALAKDLVSTLFRQRAKLSPNPPASLDTDLLLAFLLLFECQIKSGQYAEAAHHLRKTTTFLCTLDIAQSCETLRSFLQRLLPGLGGWVPAFTPPAVTVARKLREAGRVTEAAALMSKFHNTLMAMVARRPYLQHQTHRQALDSALEVVACLEDMYERLSAGRMLGTHTRFWGRSTDLLSRARAVARLESLVEADLQDGCVLGHARRTYMLVAELAGVLQREGRSASVAQHWRALLRHLPQPDPDKVTKIRLLSSLSLAGALEFLGPQHYLEAALCYYSVLTHGSVTREGRAHVQTRLYSMLTHLASVGEGTWDYVGVSEVLAAAILYCDGPQAALPHFRTLLQQSDRLDPDSATHIMTRFNVAAILLASPNAHESAVLEEALGHLSEVIQGVNSRLTSPLPQTTITAFQLLLDALQTKGPDAAVKLVTQLCPCLAPARTDGPCASPLALLLPVRHPCMGGDEPAPATPEAVRTPSPAARSEHHPMADGMSHSPDDHETTSSAAPIAHDDRRRRSERGIQCMPSSHRQAAMQYVSPPRPHAAPSRAAIHATSTVDTTPPRKRKAPAGSNDEDGVMSYLDMRCLTATRMSSRSGRKGDTEQGLGPDCAVPWDSPILLFTTAQPASTSHTMLGHLSVASRASQEYAAHKKAGSMAALVAAAGQFVVPASRVSTSDHSAQASLSHSS